MIEETSAGIVLFRKKAAHLFNVVIPKNRNLVLIYSITRVDEGQQLEMKEHYLSDSLEWQTWLHETRLLLTQANLDWVLINLKQLNSW